MKREAKECKGDETEKEDKSKRSKAATFLFGFIFFRAKAVIIKELGGYVTRR